jgi:uncharacterized protein (TIGR00299 family) protein
MPHDGPHSDHDHGHSHHDDHHRHDHSHEHAHVEGALLERGAGIGKILFLDAPSGLAGDMIIAALVDLGVPAAVIADAVAKVPITGFHLHFGSRVKSGVVATSFDVHVDDAQPERTYSAIRDLLDASTLDDATKSAAHATFLRLAKSEANVHKMPIDGVHFHEVGAVDAIVDIVGSAAALTYLGAKLIVSPLPMGRGFVKARHGVLPLPAPATVECLSGFPTYDAGLDFEFVTPTGAAIVGAHAVEAARWPTFSPQKSGWGAGTADLKDRPNLLRAILGEAPEEETSHVVIETNVDDVTGEIVANCMESLFAAGALDAWATPIIMKKGRPALTLSALADFSSADAVAAALIRETTSLGVRRYAVSRLERPRKMIVVETAFGKIAVKISSGPFGPPQIKPEFDACAAAAKTHGVPVREVIRASLVAADAAASSAVESAARK